MKKHRIITAMLAIIAASGITTSNAYERITNHIATSWGENINVNNVWTQYPRPEMKRSDWLNLNGLWNYAILPAGESAPKQYDGEILVPFAIESALSGVGKTVGNDNELWYNCKFSVPATWGKSNVILNFGAVDWKCDVWVNDTHVGSHTGGYTPFSIDITKALAKRGENSLTVRVADPTDKGFQPRGKQVSRPRGIWYTSVTGIWQTVWLEAVNTTHITGLQISSDIDTGTLTVDVANNNPQKSQAKIKVLDGDKVVATASGSGKINITMPADFKLWDTENPNLYSLIVELYANGSCVDIVESYAAMRKISAARDASGKMRIMLNNNPIFNLGPLDQGWWPDGLYTAPSHEAMVYDIDMTKQLGFNTIRKHVKVEPATWYAHCDSVGILVWQDMPSGDQGPQWVRTQYCPEGDDGDVRTAESEANYRQEWKDIIDALRNHPCIAMWVPFNEAWGQFKTDEITRWTKAYDPSRLVNSASGGNFYHTGDVLDVHTYPNPTLPLYDSNRITVVGEYGGIGLPLEGHLWDTNRNWGYVKFQNSTEVTDTYVQYISDLLTLIDEGVAAAIYTQTTDVETEVNGLITYDRKQLKVDLPRVKEANTSLYRKQ